MTTLDPPRPPGRSQRPLPAWFAIAAIVIGCAGLLLANLDKSLWSGVQGWGRPYWWLDYHNGFVRRALVGEIFQRLAGRLPEERLPGLVGPINKLFLAFLGLATLGLLASALLRQRDSVRLWVVGAVGVWIAAAEAWPTLAYNQGYMDVFVLAAAVLAALCMRGRLYAPAGVLLFGGCFVHEYFVFLAPFVLACDRSFDNLTPPEDDDDGALVGFDTAPETPLRIPVHLIVLAAAAVLGAAIVTFGQDSHAARLDIQAMPLSPADRSILVSTTMTQTLGGSFSQSAGLLTRDVVFTATAFLFFLLPTAVAIGGVLFWRGRRPTSAAWLRAAAALAPIAALLVAWDLSRLLVASNITAGIMFLVVAGAEPPADSGPRGRPARGALAGVALLATAGLAYALLPFAYIYYPPGPKVLYPLKVWPGSGRHAYGMVRLWPDAAVVPPPPPFGLHAISPTTSQRHGHWRIGPHPGDGMQLYGPYRTLDRGAYRILMHVRVEGAPADCRAFQASFHPAFSVSHVGVIVQAKSPARVTVQGSDPCSLVLESGFSLPESTTFVETPFFANGERGLLVDRYEISLVPAQSR